MSEPPVSVPADEPESHGASALAHWVEAVRARIGKLRYPRLFLKEEGLFLLLAVIIGLFSGAGVVCFEITIDWTQVHLLGSALSPSIHRLLLWPMVAGLVVSLLVIFVFPRVRGSGVNQTKAAVYIYDGYIPFSTVIGKFITCALAIGSGQSLGPEDPSLQIGAGIASALGRRLRLSRDKVRLIAPVGAAAGLAAAFNAPISAVLFVIEEVIGQWSAGVLGAIVLAAVSSVTVLRLFLKSQPFFSAPAYHLAHPIELVAYAILGVAGGLASLLFIKLINYLRPRLKRLPRWTHYFQPAAAGLMVGIIGIWFPQVLGAGYNFINQALHDQFTWQILAMLAIFKILATGCCFSSGTPGGMFAPSLFIGAMVGGTVGGLEHHFFPGLGATVGGFALVGMGTLFAGFLRVPMTSVFMVLELSGNYSIIIPVMIANTISYLITRRYEPVSLFDSLSRQDGIDLPSMEEEREQDVLHVEDAMRRPSDLVLHDDETANQVLPRVEGLNQQFFLISHRTGDWSGLSRDTLRHLAYEGKGDVPLGQLLRNDRMPFLHPDQPLNFALQEIGDWPVLPVIHRADFHNLQGLISLTDILESYRASSKNFPFAAPSGLSPH